MDKAWDLSTWSGRTCDLDDHLASTALLSLVLDRYLPVTEYTIPSAVWRKLAYDSASSHLAPVGMLEWLAVLQIDCADTDFATIPGAHIRRTDLVWQALRSAQLWEMPRIRGRTNVTF